MNPLVSVVTITYNLVKSGRSEAFCRAVDSVHNQTYDNIEHIIIDGASSDGTLDLFAPYEQAGKLTVYSEPDGGIYNAMNKGLAKVKGKYIIYLNSDDFWHNPDGIKQSVRLLELSQADFSVAPHTLQSADGRILGVCNPSPASFFANMPFCHQTMLARTDLIRSAGGFDESFKIAADYDLITRLLLRGARPIYIPCNFTTFCEGGISTQKDIIQKQNDERLRVFHKNYDDLIGPKRAEKLLKGEADSEFLQILSYVTHPSVAHQIPDTVRTFNTGRYLTTSGGAVRHAALTRTTKISSICNIPLLKIHTTPHSTHYEVLGCLPLLSVFINPTSYAAHTRTICIFGVPFIRYQYSEQSSRILLFGWLTIYKKRIK